MRIAIFKIISSIRLERENPESIIEELHFAAPDPLQWIGMTEGDKKRQKESSKDFCLVKKHPTRKGVFIINRSGTGHIAMAKRGEIKISLGRFGEGDDVAGKIAALLIQKGIKYEVSYEEAR